MNDTGYPNREHENADRAAGRRALKALDDIANEVTVLRRRIENGTADEDDTNILTDRARQLTGHLGVLRALREVREWHALDMDAAAAEVFGTTHQGRAIDARNNVPAGEQA